MSAIPPSAYLSSCQRDILSAWPSSFTKTLWRRHYPLGELHLFLAGLFPFGEIFCQRQHLLMNFPYCRQDFCIRKTFHQFLSLSPSFSFVSLRLSSVGEMSYRNLMSRWKPPHVLSLVAKTYWFSHRRPLLESLAPCRCDLMNSTRPYAKEDNSY